MSYLWYLRLHKQLVFNSFNKWVFILHWRCCRGVEESYILNQIILYWLKINLNIHLHPKQKPISHLIVKAYKNFDWIFSVLIFMEFAPIFFFTTFYSFPFKKIFITLSLFHYGWKKNKLSFDVANEEKENIKVQIFILFFSNLYYQEFKAWIIYYFYVKEYKQLWPWARLS